jgi:hypothetical protein
LASANLDTQLTAIDDFLDTEIAAIKAKTDNLPSDPADASDIATAFGTVNTKLDTIDDFLDTEIAAIKAKTDNLPASPAASGDIPAASTVASAVRTELGTELGRIDVAISTRGTGASLDAAGVRAAVGLASANLDTQIADIPTVSEFEARTIVSANYATAANLATIVSHLTDVKGATFSGATDSLEAIRDRGDTAWATATGFAVAGDIPTAGQVAATVLAAGDIDGYTLEQTLKLCLAALAGKLSGAATTTITIRAADDSKARITATVDADGNRSAVILDAAG